MNGIEKKIYHLRRQLRRWEYMYYVKNKSLVSDSVYDACLEELHQLELKYPHLIRGNSPTYSINNAFESNFARVYHQTPMLSLNSITEQSQLLSFDNRIKYKLYDDYQSSITYCCELKLDGVAISLLYEKGKLVQAATRGDGRLGEDVTKNARTVSSIPLFLKEKDTGMLPSLLEIRGEVFISKSCFLKLNQKMLRCKNKSFSNARNAASGSLRHLDPNITALRPLLFCCYGISYYIGDKELPKSHWKRLQLCNQWGMKINRYIRLVQGIDQVIQYYNDICNIRTNLKYSIDGIVIKVDNCGHQNQLSCGSKAPNWAIAYKFPVESKFAKLNDIIFQVGRTGLIIPIACISSIVIDNVTIKRVSIHNINEIIRLDLMIGDIVLVQRSGDVIPKIVRVILEKRTNLVQPIKLPKFCPVCDAKLIVQNYKSTVLRCSARLTCVAQRKAALRHFVSRRAMNIRGMGLKVIDQLVDKSLVSVPVDFFHLDHKKLFTLDGYKMKSIDRLLKSINDSKHTTLANFIYALGIPNVGLSVSYNLSIEYKTIENFIAADLQSLSKLKYIGEISAMHIYSFLRNPYNLKNIQDLIDPNIGITFSAN